MEKTRISRQNVFFKKSVIVLSGPPLHGKSTVASVLKEMSNLNLLDIEAVKSKYFSDLTAEKLHLTAKAYKFMAEEASVLLARDLPIVLSATFSKKEFKEPFFPILRLNRARIFFLELSSTDCIQERLQKRNLEKVDHPIKDLDQYRWAVGLLEPWPEDIQVIGINADRMVDLIAGDILQYCSDFIVTGLK